MDDFTFEDNIDSYKESCISYKKITSEFYLFQNQAYKIEKPKDDFILVPDGNNTELLLVLVDPIKKKIIGEATIYDKLRTIEGFIIDSRYRRMGYGEKFIKFCIDEFKINNIEVLADNIPAIKLYEKCGFKKYKKYKNGKSEMYKMRIEKIANYSEILESYLIPAEEGFLFSDFREENISKLGEKRTLLVFTTDDTLDYGGINVRKYMTKYNFSKVASFPLDQYIIYRIKSDTKCPKMDSTLKELLERPNVLSFSDDTTVGALTKMILTVCDEYSKLTNTLIIAYLSDTNKFSHTYMREYPIIITQQSMVKSILHSLTTSNSITVKQLRNNYKSFVRFDNKIPKSLYVKDMKFDLFHISPNGNIKELTPRITSKPLQKENIGVYRVSAAPSVDACFRAIGVGAVEREKDKKKTYYVYKLKLTKDMRIVKPSADLVPDQSYTNEYWVLDPVPVELLGTITVSVDEKNDTLIFDTSKMPEDPMITTKWKRVKK